MAKLYFKYGTMFSGKSLEIQKVKSTYEIQEKIVAVGKPSTDTRSNGIKSRMGKEFDCDFLILKKDNLKETLRSFIGSDVIIIDEAQFLDKEQVKDLADFTTDNDIPVLAFGLKTDFKGELFEGAAHLLALADSIEEIKGVCQDINCGKKSTMNLRLGHRGKVFRDGEQVSIGSDSYIALCRKHWKKAQDKGYYFPDGRVRSKRKLKEFTDFDTFSYNGRYNEKTNVVELLTPYGLMLLNQNELISYGENESLNVQIAMSIGLKYRLNKDIQFDILNNLPQEVVE